MLKKKIEEVILVFDDDKEAMANYNEMRMLKGNIDLEIYKNFSEEFDSLIFIIKCRTTTYL